MEKALNIANYKICKGVGIKNINYIIPLSEKRRKNEYYIDVLNNKEGVLFYV